LQETVMRAPNAVGARLNLAADLLYEERAAEALTLLDGAEAPNDLVALRHWRLAATRPRGGGALRACQPIGESGWGGKA